MQKSLSISDGRLRKARLYSTTETIILPLISLTNAQFPYFSRAQDQDSYEVSDDFVTFSWNQPYIQHRC